MKTHNKIRVMREIKQWSQEEMAGKLDMSPTGYAKIERGQSSPNLDKLHKIAEIFHINVVDLISNQDKTFFFSIGDSTHTNSHNVGLNDEYHQLLLDAKDEIIKQKDNEILALKRIIELLEKQVGVS